MHTYELSAEDDFVIVACDGLWDVVSNEEAVAFVKDTVKEPSMCAKRLVAEAGTRLSGDNVTVVVAFLRPVSTAQTVWTAVEGDVQEGARE